jgi:hypothetical protein
VAAVWASGRLENATLAWLSSERTPLMTTLPKPVMVPSTTPVTLVLGADGGCVEVAGSPAEAPPPPPQALSKGGAQR